MKKLLLAIFIFGSCLPSSHAADRELLDRVVAVVNDEVITQAELDNFLRPVYEQYNKEYSGEELMKIVQEARQKILNQMIEDKLVYQEAVREEIVVKDEDLEKEMDQFKSKMEKPEELDLMLEKEGMTLKDLRERLRKQAMIRQLQDREIRSKVVVSPAEAEDFYKKNTDKFQVKERVRVRSLTLKKGDESRQKGIPDEAVRKKIEELYQQAEAGGKFEEIVKRFSEDTHASQEGTGDWIEQGAMIESVDKAIFTTPVGKLTGVVETPIGYHVFRIEEKQPGKTVPFEEAKEQINNYLFQQKSNARFRDWMEEIKKAAYISIR
ncbi:MAG TPA: peptidyl-prolyl cis-trans isomerase [Candidatus Omnitrophota bacterium]|nr:peptidyl-prolyl cis-trans isomerase [Candidatus Omnitrophota bacterium]HPS36158.1 peptidyl-prolyl cis-trans isomerase [Candidatus Omnitrophota bacterium]